MTNIRYGKKISLSWTGFHWEIQKKQTESAEGDVVGNDDDCKFLCDETAEIVVSPALSV